MSKQKYLVECVDKSTGATEFRAFVARNPVEATSHAQLLGFMVGRVELAPGEPEPASPAPAPPRRRRTRPAIVLGVIGGGLAISAAIILGMRAYSAHVEEGLPPPPEFDRINEARKSAPRTPEPEPEYDPVPKLSLGGSITLGSTTFTPVEVLLAPASGEQRSGGRSIPIRGAVNLMLRCTLRNDSKGEVYSPFRPETTAVSAIRDDRGRILRSVARPADGMWDGQSFAQLRAGEESTNLLVCQAPIDDSAETFTWRVFVLGSNREFNTWSTPEGGRVVDVTFAASDILRQETPPSLNVVRQRGPVRTIEYALARRTTGIGGVLDLEGARVTIGGIRRVSELPATRTHPDGTKEPRIFRDPQLVLDLSVQNTSSAPIAPFRRETLRSCIAVDEFGNTMHALRTDPDMSVDGQYLGEIAPGQTVQTLLVVAVPANENPGACVWSIQFLTPGEDPARTPEARNLARVEFSAADIK
jgi:hypothetical protein